MSQLTTVDTKPQSSGYNQLTAGQLAKWAPAAIFIGAFAATSAIFATIAAAENSSFNLVGAVLLAVVIGAVVVYFTSRIIEGPRKANNRIITLLITSAFILALIPLISLVVTVVINGAPRFDISFFTESMRNVVGQGGGALHAIIGTLLVTLAATIISVPIGLLTAIYLVEYGRGPLARAITFFVDVMTGIPSIVAGLFAYSLFLMVFGPGSQSGIAGAIALSVLMIPVVVRSSEEMLRLVPNELREASYALGVPKWLTVLKVVLPTSIAGIATGVTIAIARVIGETAPLLIVAGFTQSMNYNLFDGPMMTLPVFVYNSYMSQGVDAQAYVDRAWTGALVLILIVMALNLIARMIARFFAPKLGR